MEFIILDLDSNIDEKTLLDAIKNNHSKSLNLVNEIKKIESKDKKVIKNENPVVEGVKELDEIIEIDESDLEFEDEITYYMSLIENILSDDNLDEDIKDVLPSKKNINYENILLRINIELLKQIKTIDEILTENEEDIDMEDIKEFKDEVTSINKKINVISELLSTKDNTEETEDVNNTLIFVPNENGNIRIFDEIDKIDREYHESFRELFLSIKDGSFKRVKQFNTTNNKCAGVSQVKAFKTRVVFDRIGKNEYALVTAFIKKTNSDDGYLKSLELRIKSYLSRKELVKKMMKNDEFMEQNKLYEEELFNRLAPEKGKEYKKGE